MKYLLLTYLDENAWEALTPEEQEQAMATCAPQVQEMVDRGQFLDGAPLEHSSRGLRLRLEQGKKMITDGPFTETREQLGGYTLLEADSIEQAVEIASGFLVPGPFPAYLEIRPVVQYTPPEAG